MRTLWYACDHKQAVVTLDASHELDMITSGALDSTVSLRVVSTGKFLRLIFPQLHLGGIEYSINLVRRTLRDCKSNINSIMTETQVQSSRSLSSSSSAKLLYCFPNDECFRERAPRGLYDDRIE